MKTQGVKTARIVLLAVWALGLAQPGAAEPQTQSPGLRPFDKLKAPSKVEGQAQDGEPGRPARPNYAENPLQLLLDCQAAQQKTTGFTAIFTKRERIGDRLREPETMFMKCRYSPFSVYCKWLKHPNKDREIIYVEGQHGNMVVGHQPPLPIEVRREPNHPDALKESLFPITYAGMLHISNLLADVALAAQKAGDLRLYCTEETYNGRPAWRLVRVLPRKAQYPAFICYVYVDQEWMAPVRIATFDWDDNLTSTYTFSDVTLNPPLSDLDFSRYNPSYRWPLNIFEKPRCELSRGKP